MTMTAARVRELFPDAEIDDEGFFTKDGRIKILLGADFGPVLNTIGFSFEQFDALVYWYQHASEFGPASL